MDKSVLYIQTSEYIAQTVKGQFGSDELEFLIAPNAQEAFAIYESRDIFLTLTDSNIPDMKLMDFIDKCQHEYPDMVLNVCLDIAEPKNITQITGKPNVKKIFLPPWDVNKIVDGVRASIDSTLINNDYKRRRDELESEEAIFASTLSRLKESLLRQRYSYNKIEPLFTGTLNAFLTRGTVSEDTAAFIRNSCDKILLLQTTAAINHENLLATAEANAREITQKYPGFSLSKMDSCIMDEYSKSVMADIVFAIWMICYYEAKCFEKVDITIDSRYLSTSVVEFMISSDGSIDADNEEMRTYVELILANVCEGYEVLREDSKRGYTVRFSVQ